MSYLSRDDTSSFGAGEHCDAGRSGEGGFRHGHPKSYRQHKNVATNTVRSVTTGGSGDFNVPFLAAGRYAITVEAAGFQTCTLEGITLDVGQTARVDTQLKVGTVSEVVQVDSVAVAAQTEDAVVGTAIDAHNIEDLPLNGRQVCSGPSSCFKAGRACYYY